MPNTMSVHPVPAPVQDQPFDLLNTLLGALELAGVTVQTGDVIAVSSKYAAISEGRVVNLADVVVTAEAQQMATEHQMLPAVAQLVMDEADHIYSGMHLGFMLTAKDGVLAPNAGLDRSNIPSGKAVLYSQAPYQTAAQLRLGLQAATHQQVGVILTDSWLIPGRLGTSGVALASAGFEPIHDGRSITDLIATTAELVMGERAEATPFAVVRGAPVTLTDAPITMEDVAVQWRG